MYKSEQEVFKLYSNLALGATGIITLSASPTSIHVTPQSVEPMKK
jgi:hypothetical protein